MNSLSQEEKEISLLFQKAARLKEQARTSVDNLDPYFEASTLFKSAAALSAKLAEDEATDSDEKIQHLVFGSYYSYEEHYCLGAYYYEKHEPQSSIKHHRIALQHLNDAVTTIKNLPTHISEKTKRHLVSFLSNWQHFRAKWNSIFLPLTREQHGTRADT